jgi:hypothetical protein
VSILTAVPLLGRMFLADPRGASSRHYRPGIGFSLTVTLAADVPGQ